jgi:hypothetical protein
VKKSQLPVTDLEVDQDRDERESGDRRECEEHGTERITVTRFSCAQIRTLRAVRALSPLEHEEPIHRGERRHGTPR